jgi:integrase
MALLPQDRRTGLIFPNASDEALSDAAMRKYLQEDMKRPGITVHGFRSTFRQWVKDRTNVAGEIAEAALAHVNGDKTEAAYDRSDALERRRQLMQMWSRFCIAGAPATGDVIPMREAR